MADKRKRSSGNKGGGVISNVVGQTTGIASEATRIAGEVLDSATNMTNTARETGADWVKGVSPTAAELIRPGKRKQKSQAKRSARKTQAGKAAAGEVRAARKTAARVSKATTRATKQAGGAARQAARSASKTTKRAGKKR